MSGDRRPGWLLVTFGALWLALTGACTLNVAKDDSYGFWVLGLYVMGFGLIPLFFGLPSFVGTRQTGMILTVLAGLGVLGSLGMVAWIVRQSLAGAQHYGRSPSELIGPLATMLTFVVGPPAGFLVWGIRMLRSAQRHADRGRQRP